MTGHTYSDLHVWQQAVDLVCDIYRASAGFPSEERFGLTSQLRRAVVSIPANIAEGQGRSSKKEFMNFLSIAHGSLREVETYLVISERLGYLATATKSNLLAQAESVGRMLGGLRNSLR